MSAITSGLKRNVKASPAEAGLGPSRGRSEELSDRERFLKACQAQPVDRPPLWLMRQAGRVLPEYRALKAKHSFVELVQTPELAAEVTLQPIRRFGFDAAILFSDILVTAEALGQSYRFDDQGGITLEFSVRTRADVDRLATGAVRERLQYVAEAIILIKKALAGRTALIGFAGSPWTLANFMMEGGSAEEFTQAKALFYNDRMCFERLMEKLTTAVTEYLQMQIEAGADAVQIFDSLGGTLAGTRFAEASARWIQRIVAELKNRAPVIVFSKGAHGNWKTLAETGADVLGVDWSARLSELRSVLPKRIGLQGNLDPFVLTSTPEVVATEAGRILEEMRGRPGHIFNLGHGVPPTAKLENIERLVTTVRSFA